MIVPPNELVISKAFGLFGDLLAPNGMFVMQRLTIFVSKILHKFMFVTVKPGPGELKLAQFLDAGCNITPDWAWPSF